MGRGVDHQALHLTAEGVGKRRRRRRRCENVSYQFEVLNAADEIRRIRPAAFNIYAIFKKNKILK